MSNEIHKSLSLDEREAIADLLSHEGYAPLLKLVEALAVEQETKVLRLSADEGAEKLFQAKLKAEGARKLYIDIQQIKNKFKGQLSAPPKV